MVESQSLSAPSMFSPVFQFESYARSRLQGGFDRLQTEVLRKGGTSGQGK